jgi:hypothetical protein
MEVTIGMILLIMLIYIISILPESVFANFKNKINDLVLNYPIAQDAIAGLIGDIIQQPSERIIVGTELLNL